MKRVSHIAAMLSVAAFPPMAWAAGPYAVDDGGIVDPGRLQIESWVSHDNKGDAAVVVNPAYQLLPNAEFSLQMTHTDTDGNGNDTLAPQVKYLWREGNGGKDIASSIAFGGSYGTDTDKLSNLYAYVPATLSVNDRIDFNANLGWLYTHEEERHYLTWGIGTELHASESISFIGEVFGKNEGRAGMQLGTRTALSPSLLLDAVYGKDIAGTPGDTVTAGLTLTF